MAAAAPLVAPPAGGAGEQRILLNNVSWKDYIVIRDVLDGPGVRMTYSQGVLELMSPSLHHELWKGPLLPGLDFAMVARSAMREDTPQALREFEEHVRG
jgi:hypothetical protein